MSLFMLVVLEMGFLSVTIHDKTFVVAATRCLEQMDQRRQKTTIVEIYLEKNSREVEFDLLFEDKSFRNNARPPYILSLVKSS